MSLELELLVPDGTALKCRIRGLQGTDASGRFGLLPGHEPFVTVLEPCMLLFRDEHDRERYAAVDGGVLVSEHGMISIACREAIVADRLEDIADQAASMLDARRVQEKSSRKEFADLQFALIRQLRKVEQRR